MRINRTNRLALGVALLALVLPAGLAAETPDSTSADQKYAALEAQIAQLQAQVKQLQTHTVAQDQAPAPAPAAETAPPPAAPAPPPDPLAEIKSVLGGVSLTGLVDGYYGYNADHPPAPGTITEPFSYRRDAFGLNLIELQLDKPVDKSSPLGFRVALGFGDAMNAVNECSFCSSSANGDGDQTGTQYLKEGYLSYLAPIGKGLQLDFGKWVTPNGAEVIETNQNWNYSRSLLFYYAIPYYHFGARLKYTFNDKLSVAGYATNGWNNIVSDDSSDKTGGVTVAYNFTKKISLTENWMGGPRASVGAGGVPFATPGHWNNLSDTILSYNPTAKLSLLFNYDYDHQDLDGGASVDYNGVAAYGRYQVTPKVAVAVRGEYLNDHDGFATGAAQHLWETTGTLERTYAGGRLISRLEYRHDESNMNFFPYGGSGAAVGTQNTVDGGLIFVLTPAQ
jgi:Putative beta-barrel porin-2, OmpL-like. bbp2